MNEIVVRGAREHNLKNVSVRIPRDRLVVITGPSGSGKTSLAFDTIYAEGQRRYVESLSTHARRYLGRLPKPEVDLIEGLSPAIALEQGAPTRNPRSTVGTVTEVLDFLRLLYARVGVPHCPACGKAVVAHTVQQMSDRVLSLPEGTRFAVLAPVVRAEEGEQRELLGRLRKDGFVRIRVDGAPVDLAGLEALSGGGPHTVDVFVDRLTVRSASRQRLAESLELALGLASGVVKVAVTDGEEWVFSERFACAEDGVVLPELTPGLFSFNAPEGACPTCAGLGEEREVDESLVIPDDRLSLRAGAVAPWGRAGGSLHLAMLEKLAARFPDALDRPFAELEPATRRALLHGTASARRGRKEVGEPFEGILPGLLRRLAEYERRRLDEGGDLERVFEKLEDELGRYMRRVPCGTCRGMRLRPEALAVTVAGLSLPELTALPLPEARARLAERTPDPRLEAAAHRIVGEIDARIGFLVDVGLDYLTLDRRACTLSAGEAQRIRLATQIGAGLAGVLYVLDEPSIGLHPRDNRRLIDTLQALRDRGNTVLVVEHDADTIRAADHVVDMGPGAGRTGGEVLAEGPPAAIVDAPASITGAYLSGRRSVPLPPRRRAPGTQRIRVRGARANNLAGVDVDFPVGLLTCVTGVSGSGKSSLVVDTLVPAARHALHGARGGEVRAVVEGLGVFERLVEVDQAPIGRTPRSNPATFTGVFEDIRELFASLPEARARGYGPRRFSFNAKGGRCEACQGEGSVRVEMHFLPDVAVLCAECGGRRYNRETLEIRYRGSSIADVLELEVADALRQLDALPRVRDKLRALQSVGLGYLELGRSATTLSGGEAQRLKLARELARRGSGRTLYVLDEPTTGLHFTDVEVLVGILQDLVDAGHTVIVIEHDPDVIKVADHVIDLGPEGGTGGGRVVARGTPEEVAACAASHTGRHLAPWLRLSS